MRLTYFNSPRVKEDKKTQRREDRWRYFYFNGCSL